MADTANPLRQKLRRWPVALLVAFLNAIASGAITLLVAIWAMEILHVSNFEGSASYGVVFVWTPLGIITGFIVGFVASFFVARAGFVGFLERQGIALLVDVALIGAIAGLVYAIADHPPRLSGQPIEVQFELRVPTKGRSIEELESRNERPFSVRFMAGDSFKNDASMQWDHAQRTEEFITLPVDGALTSQNSRRVLTAGTAGEGDQIFPIPLPATPTKIEDDWSAWVPPAKHDDDGELAPEDRYWLRYRVQYAN